MPDDDNKNNNVDDEDYSNTVNNASNMRTYKEGDNCDMSSSYNNNVSTFRRTPGQRKYDADWRKQMNENDRSISDNNNNDSSSYNSQKQQILPSKDFRSGYNNCVTEIETSSSPSLLTLTSKDICLDSNSIIDGININSDPDGSRLRLIKGGRLRYFSPTELLRLFGFNYSNSYNKIGSSSSSGNSSVGTSMI